MDIDTKVTTAILFIFIVGMVGCRVPWSDPSGEDEGTDTGTGTIDIPDGGTGGTCPADSWDQFDNSVAPYIGGELEVRVEVSIATDFHCPWCLVFALEFMAAFERQDFKDYVRVYYHHHPLNMHPLAWPIHYAGVAVSNQSNEKFWILHDEIFLRENDLDRMTIEEVVEFADTVLALDMDQFNADRESQETIDFIQYEKSEAIEQGLSGTPSVWVCGNKVSWGDLEETVDIYLEGGALDNDTDTASDSDISDGGH